MEGRGCSEPPILKGANRCPLRNSASTVPPRTGGSYNVRVNLDHIRQLLAPYIADRELSGEVPARILTYIDTLQRWNSRTNLTALRDPEQIVLRHFGESLFAAVQLLSPETSATHIDIGSGAGFPGLAMNLVRPGLQTTLVESQNKKVTFLREIIRALKLTGVDVVHGRAEQLGRTAELVTFRAVEKFEAILPIASSLTLVEGRVAALIGSAQLDTAKRLLPGTWEELLVPESQERVLAVWTKCKKP